MENEIDFEVIQLVADALDVPAETLEKNQRLATCLTALFSTSPHSGRDKPAIILARIVLAGMLGCTLRRQETDDHIANDPGDASDFLALLRSDDVMGAFDTLERRCREAVSDGGPKRL